jgi:hypothetical protein
VKDTKLCRFSIGNSSTFSNQNQSDDGSELSVKADLLRIVYGEGLNLFENLTFKFVMMLPSFLLAFLLCNSCELSHLNRLAPSTTQRVNIIPKNSHERTAFSKWNSACKTIVAGLWVNFTFNPLGLVETMSASKSFSPLDNGNERSYHDHKRGAQ